MTTLSPDRLRALAAAAVAAPSADNHHVVRLAVDSDALVLLAAPGVAESGRLRWLLALISAGAVAENLALRAQQLGLQLRPHWFPARGNRKLLARFECAEVQPKSDPLEQAMEQRHTNRRLRYGGPPLSPAEQQLLAADASAAGGSLLWFDDPGRRKKALRLVRTAETERFRNISLHQELFGSIRFDVGWHASAEEGLPPASLELPLIERPAFGLLRHWRLQRVLNLAGMHHFIGFRAAFLPCLVAPHLCAIAASGDTDCAAISSGQAMQRVWLRATTLGLAFQVFAASAVYAQDGIDEVPASLRRQLQSGWDELSPDARPLVLFRMGFAPPASARTGRPAAESLLVDLPARN